jgi:hypothetical protein
MRAPPRTKSIAARRTAVAVRPSTFALPISTSRSTARAKPRPTGLRLGLERVPGFNPEEASNETVRQEGV